MPVTRYRLRHTRRGRQTHETEESGDTDDVRNIQANENDENETALAADNGAQQGQSRDLENERRHTALTENRQTPVRTNQDRVRRQHSGQTSPYLDGPAEVDRSSRNYGRESDRSTTSLTGSDVRLRSRQITIAYGQEFDQSLDDEELPSDIKYMKFQPAVTALIEQNDNQKSSFRRHKRRSSSCELNRTFTSSNESRSDRKENACDLKDCVQTDPVFSVDRQSTQYYESQECVSNSYQVVEVTCRSASNSSTFYNIVSYSNNIYKTRESVKVPEQDERDETHGKESLVTKRDVATNTDESFDESEFDFPEPDSGKVSQNSMASGKISHISDESGRTTATSNEFEIPDWHNSTASTPSGSISSATELSDSNKTERVSNCIEDGGTDINEIKCNLDTHREETVEKSRPGTKHCYTQTERKVVRPTRDLNLESRDNAIQPKVDTWQRDWIPACEYKRNENFQIFSKYMHFDQIHAKVKSWKSDWEPAWLKKREQVNLNTNKDFLKSLKHVGSRIDTGTRYTEGNKWSRHMTNKSKIKSAPVNKKKPPCPHGPRRTRD